MRVVYRAAKLTAEVALGLALLFYCGTCIYGFKDYVAERVPAIHQHPASEVTE